MIWTQADLNTCIAFPVLHTPGAAQTEPAVMDMSHLLIMGCKACPSLPSLSSFTRARLSSAHCCQLCRPRGFPVQRSRAHLPAQSRPDRLLPSLPELKRILMTCDSYGWARLSSYSTKVKEVDCVVGALLHLYSQFTKQL